MTNFRKPNSRLTENEIREIFRLIHLGYSTDEISQETGRSTTVILDVNNVAFCLKNGDYAGALIALGVDKASRLTPFSFKKLCWICNAESIPRPSYTMIKEVSEAVIDMQKPSPSPQIELSEESREEDATGEDLDGIMENLTKWLKEDDTEAKKEESRLEPKDFAERIASMTLLDIFLLLSEHKI